MTEDQQPAQGISRRTMTKAAAWSVPVIALAAVAPAYAASTGTATTLTFTSTQQYNTQNPDFTNFSIVIKLEGIGAPPYLEPTVLPAGTVKFSFSATSGSFAGFSDFSNRWALTNQYYDPRVGLFYYEFTYQAALTVNDGGTAALGLLGNSNAGSTFIWTLTSGGYFPTQNGTLFFYTPPT